MEEKKRVRIRVNRRENPARRKKVIDLDGVNDIVQKEVEELLQTSVTQLDANDPIGARVLSTTPTPMWGEI